MDGRAVCTVLKTFVRNFLMIQGAINGVLAPFSSIRKNFFEGTPKTYPGYKLRKCLSDLQGEVKITPKELLGHLGAIENSFKTEVSRIT